MKWCEGSTSITWESDGPSTCLWYTIILPIPPVYLMLCSVVLFSQAMEPFRNLDDKTVLLLRSMQAMCVLLAIMLVGFASVEHESGAVIWGTVLQVAAWLLCAAVMHHDAWCFTTWPNNSATGYMMMEFVIAPTYALSSHSKGHNTAIMFAQVCLFILCGTLVLLALYKDHFFRTKDERCRLETQRGSLQRPRGGSYMSHTSGASGAGLSLQHMISWFGIPYPSVDGGSQGFDEPLVRSKSRASDRQYSIASSRRSASRSGSRGGFYSWFGGKSTDEDFYDSDEEDDEAYDDEQSRATVSLLRSYNAGSGGAGAFYNECVVKSALSSDANVTDSGSSLVRNPDVAGMGGEYNTDNITNSNAGFETAENGDVILGGNLSSGVLQRALRGDRSSTGGTGITSLAPRGFSGTALRGKSGGTFSSSEPASSWSNNNQYDTYCVAVNNWGLRRDQRSYSSAAHGSMDDGLHRSNSMDVRGARGAVRDRSYAMNGVGSSESTGDDEDGFAELQSSAAPASKGHHTSFMSFRSRWASSLLGGSGGEASASVGVGAESSLPNDIIASTENADGEGDDAAGDDPGDGNGPPENAEDHGVNATTRRKLSDPPAHLPGSSTNNLMKQKPLVRTNPVVSSRPHSMYFNTALGSSGGAPANAGGIRGEEIVSLDTDCELMQREFGAGAEIEFEICIRGGGKGFYPGGNADIWRIGQGNSSSGPKWAVWKTAKEIVTLHSSVLSVLGDAAPRRPKLKTIPEHNRSSTGNNTIIPHASIVSDMRNIAAYLTGLLQHHRHLRCAELYNFLEFAEHTTTGTTSRATTGADGQNDVGSESEREMYDEGDDDADVSDNERQSDAEAGGVAIESSFGAAMNTAGGAGDGAATGVQAQERWRKLFVNMRVHLKPSAIAIRCRLFEGVISGSDICKWLVQSQYKFAQDSAEACVIGQELVSSGLLHAVCCGHSNSYDAYGGQYYDSEEEEDEASGRYAIMDENSSPTQRRHNNEESSRLPMMRDTVVDAATDATKTNVVAANSGLAMTFSTGTGYLYRYPSKSNTGFGVGSYSLFGSMINVAVVRWAKRDDRFNADEAFGATRSLRESLTLGYEVEKRLEAGTEGQGYIHYEIVVKHQNDEWVMWKRYREFEQYNKQLAKCGIRPALGLPSKRIMSSVSTFGQSVNTQIETRRASLEAFLVSAVEAVMVAVGESSGASATAIKNADLARIFTAQFLDDDYSNLIMVEQIRNTANAAATSTDSTDEV